MAKNLSPIFIVSTGRSGSKMLAQLLSQHPRALALHEPIPSLFTLGYAAWAKSISPQKVKQKLLANRSSPLRQVRDNGLVYIESSHFCSHLMVGLHELFDAKFIFVHRSPEGFVRSCIRKGMYGWVDDIDLKERVLQKVRRHFVMNLGRHGLDHRLSPPAEYQSQVGKAAWLWSEMNGAVLNARSLLGEASVLEFSLHTMSESCVLEILDFCGLDAADVSLEHLMALAQSRPNLAVGPDHSWSALEQEEFERASLGVAQALGYSPKRGLS